MALPYANFDLLDAPETIGRCLVTSFEVFSFEDDSIARTFEASEARLNDDKKRSAMASFSFPKSIDPVFDRSQHHGQVNTFLTSTIRLFCSIAIRVRLAIDSHFNHEIISYDKHRHNNHPSRQGSLGNRKLNRILFLHPLSNRPRSCRCGSR